MCRNSATTITFPSSSSCLALKKMTESNWYNYLELTTCIHNQKSSHLKQTLILQSVCIEFTCGTTSGKIKKAPHVFVCICVDCIWDQIHQFSHLGLVLYHMINTWVCLFHGNHIWCKQFNRMWTKPLNFGCVI